MYDFQVQALVCVRTNGSFSVTKTQRQLNDQIVQHQYSVHFHPHQKVEVRISHPHSVTVVAQFRHLASSLEVFFRG